MIMGRLGPLWALLAIIWSLQGSVIKDEWTAAGDAGVTSVAGVVGSQSIHSGKYKTQGPAFQRGHWQEQGV